MSKHPIDHDRRRGDAKVAQKYAKIEREVAGEASDPKVQAMNKGARAGEKTPGAGKSRMKAFLKIERESADS